jgi:hypothetical protein
VAVRVKTRQQVTPIGLPVRTRLLAAPKPRHHPGPSLCGLFTQQPTGRSQALGGLLRLLSHLRLTERDFAHSKKDRTAPGEDGSVNRIGDVANRL